MKKLFLSLFLVPGLAFAGSGGGLTVEVPLRTLTDNSQAVVGLSVNEDGDFEGAGTGGAGGASTIADGADVTQGANADASVAAGAAGTISAKLRRLTTDTDAIKTSAAASATAARQPAIAPSEGAGVVDTGTQRVVLASDGPTVTVLGATNDSAAGDATGSINAHARQVAKVLTAGTQQVGAANASTGQVTATTTAGTFVAARSTRRFVTFRNGDAAISVYVGGATVTSANGFILKAGESYNWYGVGLVQVISASGTPTVYYSDYYD